MNKVMIIIDEPKTCEECPCIQAEMDYETVRYRYCGLDFHTIETYSRRDENCPLKQMHNWKSAIECIEEKIKKEKTKNE